MQRQQQTNQFHLLKRVARTDSIIFAEHERGVASCDGKTREDMLLGAAMKREGAGTSGSEEDVSHMRIARDWID